MNDQPLWVVVFLSFVAGFGVRHVAGTVVDSVAGVWWRVVSAAHEFGWFLWRLIVGVSVLSVAGFALYVLAARVLPGQN